MIRRLAAVLLLAAIGTGAEAASLAGVTLPQSYAVDGRTLVLNGIGLRTVTIFSVRIYVAGLYLSRPSHDAQQILASPEDKVIVLKFLHAGTKAEVEHEYRAGELANCGSGGCADSDRGDFERLVAAAPAVKPGDSSTYIFTSRGVQVLANDRSIGSFNRDLGYHLLAGFIGAHPPSPELRRQLLGLPES